MTTRADLLADLSGQIRRLERSRSGLVRETTGLAFESAGLSNLIPDVSDLRGGLIEWLTDCSGSGGITLALLACRPAVGQDLWVLVDHRQQMYAPGLSELLDLSRLVVVKPEQRPDMLWVVEQALRTRGVGAVVCEIDRLSSAAFRRLQLAAETGGSLGILLRPAHARGQPSWAEYRLQVRPVSSESSPGVTHAGRRFAVELLRSRKGLSQKAVIVELNDADNRLCVVSELVPATTAVRATGA